MRVTKTDIFFAMLIRHKFLGGFYLFLFFITSFSGNLYKASTEEKIDKNLRDEIINELENNVYILGPGDLIEVVIYQFPDKKERLSILNDGTFPLPFAGNIYISGMSLDEAKMTMKNALEKELLRPDLQVRLIKPRPISVSIIGEVVKQGLYNLDEKKVVQENNLYGTDNLPRVVDAIQLAGGITGDSNLKEVILFRNMQSPRGYKKTKLNLISLFLEGDQSQNPYLFDGDIIKIEKAKSVPESIAKITMSNLAPDFIRVNVIGEVLKPGEIKIPANTSLSQAILLAGGPLDLRSNLGSVELLRVNENGSLQLKKYRINFSNDVNQLKNPLLKSGDLLRVRKSFVAKGSDTIETIAKPISGVITTWSLFKLISP